MNSDFAFYIGDGHKICQDYAVARSTSDMDYVIIGDGCSSSPDTDIGARFLVKAAESFIYQIEVSPSPLRTLERYHQQSIHFASLSSKVLRLDPSCLDATLMTVKAEKKSFVVSCYGDGVVAMVRKDGRLEIYSVDFLEGYPQYLNYTLDAIRKKEFDKQTANLKEVTYHLLPNQSMEPAKIEVSEQVIEFHHGTIEDYTCVAILSDGVHSFTEIVQTDTTMQERRIPMTDIVPLILAFKSTKGEFVQRRMQAFHKFCTAKNWKHSDDLSVAAVCLG